jgi:hypothetical protein
MMFFCVKDQWRGKIVLILRADVLVAKSALVTSLGKNCFQLTPLERISSTKRGGKNIKKNAFFTLTIHVDLHRGCQWRADRPTGHSALVLGPQVASAQGHLQSVDSRADPIRARVSCEGT